MTSVNITTTKNTVTVNEGDTTVVNIATQGPQGPAFAATGTSLNDSNKIDNSIVYFSSSDGTFKADATRTVENLVDGGSF
tara:strand:+ start:3661 stop:3900 length:240 start_codon:yes stop_codon:yes gene_type:complete